jgi:hypothetical protein
MLSNIRPRTPEELSRFTAFLEELTALSKKHNLHIDAEGDYCDSFEFGIHEGRAKYALENESYSYFNAITVMSA